MFRGSLGLVVGDIGVLLGLFWCPCGHSVASLIFKTCSVRQPHPVFCCAFLHVARVPLRNLFISPICFLSLISCVTVFFQVVVFLILEPLGVDFEHPSGPSDLEKSKFPLGSITLGSKDALDYVLGLSWARFGCSWGASWALFWFQTFLFGYP